MKTLVDMSRPNSIVFLSFLGFGILGCTLGEPPITFGTQVRQILAEDSVLIDDLHEQITDSLRVWVDSSLYSVRLFKKSPYILDEMVCFNKKRDKLLTSVNSNKQNPDGSLDQLTYLYGVKITNRWHFFFGPAQFVYREKVKDGNYRAHSPSELHEKTVKYVYSGYLKRRPGGDYEINDKFFENMGCTDSPRPGYCQCKSCDTFEDWVLFTVRENWQRRDTTDWEQKRREEKVKRKRI